MLPDSRFREALGQEARYVHLDTTVEEIPMHRPIGRQIRRLLEASPTGRMAFGIFFVTDAEGTTLYGLRPCGCRRYGPLRTGADLLHLASQPDLVPSEEVDLEALRSAVGRFQQHRELRRQVALGADAAELLRFEGTLSDYLSEAHPCKMLDAGGRASTLTVGCLLAAGGHAGGLARMLDPTTSPAPAVRDMIADGLSAGALRDDPYPEAAGPHLGLTYLLLARQEIGPAVAAACGARGCTPADLPIHALPVPTAARERAARLALGARGLVVPEDESALATLRCAIS